MKVYAFQFTDCIYESAMYTVSLHTTKRGAFKAMVRHVNDKWHELRRFCSHNGHDPLKHYRWSVREMDVMDP